MQGSPPNHADRTPGLQELREHAARRLRPPAIALMIYCGLVIVGSIFLAIVLLVDGVGGGGRGAADPDAPPAAVLIAVLSLTALVHGRGIWGGLSMYRVQNFGLAITATVIGYLSFCGPCWMFGFPFAVWATVVLASSGTQQLFRGELPPPAARATSGGGNTTAIIVAGVVAGPLLVAMVGVMAALAIYGVRRYVLTAKTSEAKAGVVQLAHGIAECHAATGALPPTTNPVPLDLGSVAGQKYQSAPADWQQPAFDCAGFRVEQPQYYQYSWETEPDGVSGYAVARGDLNGDGTFSTFRVLVECYEQCQVASQLDEHSPLE